MTLRRRACTSLPALAFWLVFGPAGASAAEAPACAQPEPVCAARAAVFAIAGFDPVGSAVRLEERVLATARHVVADRETVELFLPDGMRITARVVPSAYRGDIVLLEADGLPSGPALAPAALRPATQLFTVGADVSLGLVRAYDAGRAILPPAEGKPLARLHHTAYSQPGNSGGALVDERGGLVGIVASGGEGRFEAVPAAAIAALREWSGPDRIETSREIGTAVRVCALNLDRLRGPPKPLAAEEAKALETSCTRSGNRQFVDLAAQAFGARADFDRSIRLFETALEEDSHALNSRLGLVVTYHLAARYEEELPHLRFLLQHLPEDNQVLRLALQAGVWGGDRTLAEAALATLKRVNPQMVPVAQRFLDNPPPRPKRR